VEFDGIDRRGALITNALDEKTDRFFDDGQNLPVKAEVLAVKGSRDLKAVIPASLVSGTEYTLKIVTQNFSKRGALPKNLWGAAFRFQAYRAKPMYAGSGPRSGLVHGHEQPWFTVV
jgi:hypothetical protein